MAIVADETVFGPEPHESLRVLQRHEDRTLRQTVGARQVLQDEWGRVGRRGRDGHLRETQDCGDQGRTPEAVVRVGTHWPKMHEANLGVVDSGSGPGHDLRFLTGRASHSVYSFGTQDSMDAGVIAGAPGRDVFHQGTP